MEVFTIPAAVAFDWLRGFAGEMELRAAANTAPDFVFLMQLDGLADYRALLDASRHALERGSVALAVRTKNPVALAHCLKMGCVTILVENHPNGDQYHRLMASPEAFKRWVSCGVKRPQGGGSEPKTRFDTTRE